MKIYAQVLGTATGDSTPTILIFFDQKRFLFNCGEGTQRFCTEHKIRLARIKDVFLTRLHWENTGGLPGALLTVADAVQYLPGPQHFSIYGPRHTRNFITSLRYFINRRHMMLQVREFVENAAHPDAMVFDDGNLRITAVELVLPSSEPALAPCLSTTPPPPSLVSIETIVEEKENEKEKETEKEKKSEAEMDTEVSPSSSSSSAAGNRKRKSRGQRVYSSVVDSPAYAEGDRSSHIVLAHDIGALSSASPPSATAISPSHAPRKRTKSGEGVDDTEETGRMAALVERNEGPSTSVVCYICRSPDLPGKFDAKQAKALGVPSGPLFGRLCKGETITLPNGRQVQPSDCIGPPRPGTVFAIVHCPSEEYVDVLVHHPAWRTYTGAPATAGRQQQEAMTVGCILHMTPQRVLAHHDAYRGWMHSFGTTTQHVVVNEHACPQRPVFLGATRNHYKLHSLHPGIFPMPCLGSRAVTLPSGLPKKAVVGEPLLKFLLAPPTAIGLDTSEVLKPVDEKEVAEEMEKNDELRESTSVLRTWLQSFDGSDAAEAARRRFGGPANQPEVLFLGTGAAIPSKYRNVSSVYVSVPSFGGLLLDSGEGSFGQLARRFGFEHALKVVEELKVVLISHMHADHHLGLLRILALRQDIIVRHKNTTRSDATALKAEDEEGSSEAEQEDGTDVDELERGPAPLVVVGPPALKEWLDEYSSQIQRLTYRFVPCHALNHPTHPISGYLEEKLGLTEVRSTEVVHCPFAYGFALTHRSGWKIVYSGDTRPCPQLAEVGRGASLLIHEATFEDGMADEAIAKYHSTTSEALSSGAEMGAEFVAMFHFSQRYPKIPVVESAGAEERMGIAFDLMSTPLHLLPVLPHLLPSLRALFKEDEEGEEGEDMCNKDASGK